MALERSPSYVAINQSSTLLGLPYGFALPFMAGTVLPLIWSLSVATAIWCIAVYLVCRYAAEQDEKIVDVLLRGLRAVPGTRTRKMFGGDSYGA